MSKCHLWNKGPINSTAPSLCSNLYHLDYTEGFDLNVCILRFFNLIIKLKKKKKQTWEIHLDGAKEDKPDKWIPLCPLRLILTYAKGSTSIPFTQKERPTFPSQTHLSYDWIFKVSPQPVKVTGRRRKEIFRFLVKSFLSLPRARQKHLLEGFGVSERGVLIRPVP